MPIINPDGLFRGERLARCSDDAQLHWVRLFTASNTFGRLELSYQNIIFIAYRNIRTKPTEAEIARWIQEYFDNFLLFVYDCEDGSTWGQWLTDAKFLSTYQTAADRRSPAPDEKALEEYRRKYISSKRAKSLRINRLSKPHQTTSNHIDPDHTVSAPIKKPAREGTDENEESGKPLEINNIFEPHETISLGIGIGIGVKQKQEQKPSPAAKRGRGDSLKSSPPSLPAIAPPWELPDVPADPPVPTLLAEPPKPPTKTALVESRHAELKAAIGDYWKAKNPDAEMPWGQAEGRNLAIWMRESPNTTLEQFTAYLRHRFRSDVNHAERPSDWIRNITRYAAGPLDRYGKPLKPSGYANGPPAPSAEAEAYERKVKAIMAERKAHS